MSSSVDQRIVQMEFDNSNFNKNVQGTLDSLTKLDKSLELKNGVKGLENVENAAKNIKFAPLQTAISALGNGLSSFGSAAVNTFTGVVDQIANVGKVATMTVAGLTTAVGGLAVSGGIKRALNLEHANFQLQGLLKSDKKVAQVMNDVNEAVTGTAYGLDEAAVVASQLAASNVKASESGGEMLNVLKAIAGTAAMGGRSFADVGSIFATVAGQGKLMTMQLRQMESMGLNAAATLADALGEDEATIREMVTAGEIDFATFAKAMSDAFGEHAQKANETFTGAMSNVKAALSRVGAEFAAPSIENLRKIFVALIPIINQVKTGLAPVVDMFKDFTGGATDQIVNWLKKLSGTYKIGEQFGQGIVNITKYLTGFGDMLAPIIGPQLGKLDQWGRVFGNVMAGISAIGGEVGEVVKGLGFDFAQFFKPLDASDTISSKIIKLSANFRHFAESIKIDPKHRLALSEIFKTLLNFGKSAGTIISGAFKGFANVAGPALEFLWAKLPDVADGFKNFADGISNVIGPADQIAQTLENIGSLIGSIFKAGANGENPFDFMQSDAFIKLAEGSGLSLLGDLLSKVGGILGTITDVVSGMNPFEAINKGISAITGQESKITGISDAVKQLLNFLSGIGSSVIDKLVSGFGTLGDVIGQIKDGVKDFLSGKTIRDIAALGLAFGGLWSSLNISNLSREFEKFLKNLGTPFESVLGTIRNAVFGPFEKTLERAGTALVWWQNTLRADMLVKIGVAIALIAGSIALLASVDSDGLFRALLAMSVIGGILMGLMDSVVAMSTLQSSGKGIKGFIKNLGLVKEQMQQLMMINAISNVMMKFAASVLILAVAIKILGGMDIEELAKGFITMVGVMVVLVAAINALDTSTKDLKGAGSTMMAAAVAMLILGAALKVFASIKMDQIPGMLMSLGGSLLMLVGAMALLGQVDKTGTSALSLLAIAAAVAILTPALMALSLLPLQNIAQMLVALGGSLAILGTAMYLMSDDKMLSGVDAMIGLAAAVLILAPALLLLSSIGFEGTAVAIVALGGAFAVLGIAGYLLKPLVPTLFSLAGAVALFGAGLLAAGVGVAAFAVGLTTLAAGGTGSLLILAEGFKMLLQVVITTLPEMALALANALISFGVGIAARGPEIITAISGILTAILQAIAQVAPQFIQTGVAIMVAFLQGVRQITPEIMATGFTLIVALMVGVLIAVPTLVNLGVQAMITFINTTADTIRSKHQAMYDAAKNLFLALLEALGDIFANLFTDIGSFIADIPAYISGEKELFADAGTDIGTSTTESAEDSLSNLPDVGGEAVNNMLDSMKENMAGSEDIFSGLGDNLASGLESADFTSVSDKKMNQLLKSFSSGDGKMKNAGKSLGTSEISGLELGLKPMASKAESKTKEAISKAKGQSGNAKSGGREVGDSFGSGMNAGMDSWIGPIANKAAEMVRRAKSSAKSEQNSNSPSKDTMEYGEWFGEGYAIGIGNTMKTVGNAASLMVQEAETTVNGFGGFSDLADMIPWDTRPVITPVLDLTEYQAGISQMNNMAIPPNVIASAGWAGRFTSLDSQSSTTGMIGGNSITIMLNYDAGADANQMVMDIANGLETRLAMEGA